MPLNPTHSLTPVTGLQIVTHSGINGAQRGVTLLIKINVLTLRQTVCVCMCVFVVVFLSCWYGEEFVVFSGSSHEGRQSSEEQRVNGARHDGEDDHPDGRISTLRTSEPGLCHDPWLLCRTQETCHHPAQGFHSSVNN